MENPFSVDLKSTRGHSDGAAGRQGQSRSTAFRPLIRAFAQVEAPGAGLQKIADYWEFQIKRGEEAGLPGPGCLLANTMTERARHSPDVEKVVTAHNNRLRAGFRNALRGPGIAARHRSSKQAIDGMATALAIFSNGLWSYSRVTPDARPLRNATKTMISNLAQE